MFSQMFKYIDIFIDKFMGTALYLMYNFFEELIRVIELSFYLTYNFFDELFKPKPKPKYRIIVSKDPKKKIKKSYIASYIILNKLPIHCVKEHILSFISGFDGLGLHQFNELVNSIYVKPPTEIYSYINSHGEFNTGLRIHVYAEFEPNV